MALNREWEMRGNICDAARIAEWVDLDVGRMLKVDTHFTTPPQASAMCICEV